MTTDLPTDQVRSAGAIDRFVLATVAACSALYAFFIWRPSFDFRGQHYFTLFDDAMISLTYARNLANGDGLVWNPGGPAVEGYTNPLWTLIMAGAHRLGLSEATVPLVVSIISAGLVVGCMLLAACIARRVRPASRYGPRLAAIFVGLFYPLVYWALRGMEVGLVTFLLLAAVLLAARLKDEARGRDVALLCLVVGLGLATRDDFVVPAMVIGGWLLVTLRGRARWIVAGPLVLASAAVIGAQLAFRLSYYGDPLPNTYYLKVANQPLGPRWTRGLLFLLSVFVADVIVLFGTVVAGMRADRSTGRSSGRSSSTRSGYFSKAESADGGRLIDRLGIVSLLVAVATSLALYSVYVGGDAWEVFRIANRYVTPAIVVLLILAASFLEPLVSAIRRAPRPIFWMTLILVSGLVVGLNDNLIGVSLGDWFVDYQGITSTVRNNVWSTWIGMAIVLLLAWFVGGRRKLGGRLAKGPLLVGLLAAAILFSAVGNAWYAWMIEGGFYTERNKGATAYGIELGDLTDPGASIAVIWAGAPIYYSHRDGVDLLGKMDPVIAHGPHHEGIMMYPGHDKFDFDYSIGRLRPDVIAQYAWFTSEDVDHFVADGYQPMTYAPGEAADLRLLDVPRALLWVRNDSTKVHRDRLVPISVDEARARTVERK